MRKYIETLMSIEQVIKKGYLNYEPKDLLIGASWSQNGYTVTELQGTYMIFKEK